MANLVTLQKLRELPVGAKMIAYVGNFDYDIARCDKMSPMDKGAPRYKHLLVTLQDSLDLLQASGIITVAKQERKHQRTNNKGKELEWRDFVYEVTRLK